jgi:hypothetical protein
LCTEELGLDTQGLETGSSYQDDTSSALLDNDKVWLYSDTETVNVISVMNICEVGGINILRIV